MKYMGIDVLNLMQKAKNYNMYLVDLCLAKLTPSTKMLDFGAGCGSIATILRDKGFDIECIELDPDLQSVLKEKEFVVFDNIMGYQDNSIESIVSFNVFEHIENDKKVLEEIYKKLKPDGKFFFFVPAYSFLYSEFDRKLGHFRRYDLKPVVSILEECGFKILSFEYVDSIGFILALIYKIFRKNGKISIFSILFYDKILLPITKLTDKFYKKKFGKNLAFVLTKE
ncbi:MAG: class I SAM-dependent methyltransferase [Cyanobacteria bacterium SIG28]|nr:class I SAM-dependent methyltransferase [Cyanobacteria bacterium SIG28]